MAMKPDAGRSSTTLDPRRAQMIDEARRSLLCVNDILTAVTGLVGGRTPDLQRTNLWEVAESAVAKSTDLTGIHLELAGERDVLGWASASLVEQVLGNLLRNAAEAARKSAGPRIRVRVYATVTEARISVRDNGAGVPMELRERIFEPFFTTKSGGGVGLGLTMSRHVLARMGGALVAAPDPPPGACFRVRLRRA
jgi:signal transduction histidine kinase